MTGFDFALYMIWLIGGVVVAVYVMVRLALLLAVDIPERMHRWRQRRAFQKLRKFDEQFPEPEVDL